MARPKKKDSDIVTPSLRTYPKEKTGRRPFRTGFIQEKGREVPVTPDIHRARPAKPLTEYNNKILWKMNEEQAIALNLLVKHWQTNRHEVLRRIWRPIAAAIRDADADGKDGFSINIDWKWR